LVTVIGEQLEPSLTLAEQQVRHGTILRLVDVDAAPPPPDVADVTEAVGDLTEARADAWRREGGIAVAAVHAAGLDVGAAFFGAWADEVAHALAPGVLAALAVVTARRQQPATAVVLTGAAAGLALAPAGALTARYLSGGPAPTLLVWLALAGAVLGVVLALGFSQRATGAGALVAAALVAVWILAQALGLAAEPAAALTAVLGTATLG